MRNAGYYHASACAWTKWLNLSSFLVGNNSPHVVRCFVPRSVNVCVCVCLGERVSGARIEVQLLQSPCTAVESFVALSKHAKHASESQKPLY